MSHPVRDILRVDEDMFHAATFYSVDFSSNTRTASRTMGSENSPTTARASLGEHQRYASCSQFVRMTADSLAGDYPLTIVTDASYTVAGMLVCYGQGERMFLRGKNGDL